MTFTPTDTTRYTTATASTTLVANAPRTTPTVSWATPAAITQGTALSATQLNAAAKFAGTFVYTPPAGTVLPAGTHTLSVTFTTADTTRYTTAIASVRLVVDSTTKITPYLSWPTPAAITQGTALSATQLNAAAKFAGTFVYSPAAGTVLPAGTHTLRVTFTPADTVLYNTVQLVARFRTRLAAPVVALHSSLTDGARLEAWRAAASGRAPVVIGTRAAVFTPLPALGLVVVDEEHDASYKQQEGFRNSGRDLAVARAQRAGCPVVLGSATPSLESLANAAPAATRSYPCPSAPGAPASRASRSWTCASTRYATGCHRRRSRRSSGTSATAARCSCS